MNCFGRTSNNKERLRLKGFHRRNIIVGVEESSLDCDVKPLPVNPGSSSGGKGDRSGSFTYRLETLKKVYRGRYLGWCKQAITQVFNRSQLIGKVMLICGVRYRIVSKS